MIQQEPSQGAPTLIAREKIAAEARRRIAPDSLQSVPKAMQTAFQTDGWSVDQALKFKVRMRKRKPHDIAFEDKVWAMMAKLNFHGLNLDRQFRLQYGATPAESKQIDVFAFDDEVVLVVECKSSESPVSSTLKVEVEAVKGIEAGIRRFLKSDFPDHKVKFILATNNIVLTKASQDRVAEAGIAYFDEDAVDYYLGLADHLGNAARYQLLGNLFAGQKIPEMDPLVPAIQGKMGGHVYYSFAIEPSRLLKISYVLHRNKANSQLMPTYQRLIKKSRLKKVAQFVASGGFFPNSIILNIESGGRGLTFEKVSQPKFESKLGILHLPQTYRAAYVIDGQHRLYGFSESGLADKELVPVVAFVDLPRNDQVRLFMQINENQQAVPKNLRSTLNADLLWKSEDLRERSRALKLRVAQHLGEHKGSPLAGRIVVGEEKRNYLRCITIDALNNGLDRGNFIGSFTKTETRSQGTFYRGDPDATFELLTDYLELCFGFMRDALQPQWGLGSAEGGFVFMNNGVEGLMRIFSDIVDHLIARGDGDPINNSATELFEATTHYLEPLVTYLGSRDSDEALELRRSYGSAGRSSYWRRLQIAIGESRQEFVPPGLEEFKRDQSKAFNTESFEMIREIETFLNEDVRHRLEDAFGNRWFKDGVPLKVYQSATSLAADKNLEHDEDDVEPWDCLHLLDYQQIMTKSHEQWQSSFEGRYTRPGDSQKAWKSKTEWLIELNRIRNQNSHTYSVSQDEYDFLVAITAWLFSSAFVDS